MSVPARVALLISFFYDPGQEIGAVRPNALARDLAAHGWLPVVITSGDPADDVTRDDLIVRHVPASSAFRDAKRRLGVGFSSDHAVWTGDQQSRGRPWTRLGRGLVREVAGVVPDTATWPWRARSVALRAARTHRPAAVFSSAPPHTVTLLAWAVVGRLRVPWVAELQDLWVGYPIRRGTRLRRTVDRILESVVMRRVTALVTVSEPLVATLRSLHPEIPVQALPSGIDEAIVAPPGQPLDQMLTILYTGRIYNGRQDLGHVLRALRTAIDAGRIEPDQVRLRLVLLHPLADEDRATIDELRLGDQVEVETRVAREEAIERQRRAQILLHLRWDDPSQPGIMTGKIFEYLAARRPILTTGRYADAASQLISRTGAGYASESEEATAAYLGRAFEVFRATGAAPYEPDADALEALDSSHLARGVATILDGLTSDRTAAPPRRRRRFRSIR